MIQEHGLGQYQILVQLPGVDDPARVKEIMQSTAMLEIKQVLGGPYSSEQDALQQHNGVLPPDSMLLRGRSVGSQTTDDAGEQFYLVTRSSAVAGADLRSGGATRGARYQHEFTRRGLRSHQRRGKKVRRVYRCARGRKTRGRSR